MTATTGRYAERANTKPAPVTVTVSPGAKFLDANGRYSWHTRAALSKLWREATAMQIRAKRPAALKPPVVVEVVVHRTRNGRSDAPNVGAPTSKACVDGAVDAHLLPDDHDGVIVLHTFRRGPNRPRPALTLTFRPATADEIGDRA